MSHIQEVIEATYAQPSRSMAIQAGVKLKDRDKTIKGDQI